MEVKIKKSPVTGSASLSYQCPVCGQDLKSPAADAGNAEKCPECGAGFRVPGVEEVREFERREAEASERKRHLKESNAALNDKVRERKTKERGARSAEREYASEVKRVRRAQKRYFKDLDRPATSWIPLNALVSIILGWLCMIAAVIFAIALFSGEGLLVWAPLAICSTITGCTLVLIGVLGRCADAVAQEVNRWGSMYAKELDKKNRIIPDPPRSEGGRSSP